MKKPQLVLGVAALMAVVLIFALSPQTHSGPRRLGDTPRPKKKAATRGGRFDIRHMDGPGQEEHHVADDEVARHDHADQEVAREQVQDHHKAKEEEKAQDEEKKPEAHKDEAGADDKDKDTHGDGAHFDIDHPSVVPKAWMKPFHGVHAEDPKADHPKHHCNGARLQPDDPRWLWRNRYDTATDLSFFHNHEIKPERLRAAIEQTKNRGRLPIVYLFNSELRTFYTRVLPKLKEWYPKPEPHQRFVIFGPSNHDVGPQRSGKHIGWPMEWAQEIAEMPHVAAWFNENCDLDHPKIMCAPIGVDFHTQEERSVWGPRMTNEEQACMLNHYYRRQLPWAERKENLIVYLDFSLNSHKHMRHHLYPMFQGKSWTKFERRGKETESGCAERDKIWDRYSRLAFVLAPPGHGFDTHRIWESIALGAVPIVQKSEPFYERYIGKTVAKGNELYRDLPVIIVNDYKEVTEDKLAVWHEEIAAGWKAGKYNVEKLFLPYWANRIKAVSLAAFSEVSPKLPHD